MPYSTFRTTLGTRTAARMPAPAARLSSRWFVAGLGMHTRVGPRIAVTVQDTWPPRVLVTVTDLTVGDTVTVYREVLAERTALRGGATDATIDTSFVVLDAELPFGVPITYVAVIEGNDLEADATTVTLTGGNVALSDAITGESAEVVVLAWPEKQKTRRNTVFAVGGRNVVVAGQRGGFAGTVDLYTETDTARLSVDTLLEDATSGVIQIRQSGPYDGVDGYVSVLADTEKRWSQDGSDERRVWTLEVVEVEAWAASLEAAGYTLEDLADVFLGQTLDQIDDAYSTLLAISQAQLD